jgi:RsiW-degrading membrane proteinase PrsW (M82 family)
MIAAPLSAPIVEELAKWIGLLLIVWILRDEFDGVRDGFIYGALIGVGFNWFEAPLYVMQGYAEHGVAPYQRELGLRHGILGLGGHALFTGIAGMFLGFAVQMRRRWVRWTVPVVGLLIAILGHLINNIMPLLQALSAAGQGAAPQQQFRQARADHRPQHIRRGNPDRSNGAAFASSAGVDGDDRASRVGRQVGR